MVDRDIVARLLSFTQLCLKCVLSYLVSLIIPLPWVTSGPSILKLMWVCPILGIWVSIPLLNIDCVLMTGSFPFSCCFYHHVFCCLFTGLWRGKTSWLLVLCVYAHFFLELLFAPLHPRICCSQQQWLLGFNLYTLRIHTCIYNIL